MEELFNKIVDSGILIGSREWGGEKENSDYDIVISTEKTKKLLKFLDNKHISYKDKGNSSSSRKDRHTMFNDLNIDIILDNKHINIISYKEEDLIKIVKLNDTINLLKDTDIYKSMTLDKNIRIQVVETFLKVLFMETYDNDIDNLDFL